jgi:hypothetical protein
MDTYLLKRAGSKWNRSGEEQFWSNQDWCSVLALKNRSRDGLLLVAACEPTAYELHIYLYVRVDIFMWISLPLLRMLVVISIFVVISRGEMSQE